ncbi:hypothetical protein ACH492_39820 [Streptomyces sp. NPDC019443]|uniref:hypothetical protein n=1 Tax=Streptomyces sp. NPDC019443 TaxID=3365061 RepID=UPI0037ACE380
MISQSAWCRRHVVPVAKEAGLVPDGKQFRLFGERGDCAVLELQTHRVDPQRETFFARVSIVPLPERAWVHRQHWQQAKDQLPSSGSGMLQWELSPPDAVALEPQGGMDVTGLWAYSPDIDPVVCAEELTRILRDLTFPQMRRFLDRDVLLAEMKQRSAGLRHRRPPGWAQVLLNVDRVAPAALEPLLDEVETDYPVADEFIAWAREQAADWSRSS